MLYRGRLVVTLPGQRYDAASGLNQNYQREFEAGIGRYTQPDPIGLDGGISSYTYVESDPLTGYDPEGEQRRGISRNNRWNPLYGRRPLEETRVPLGAQFYRLRFAPDSPNTCSACLEIIISLPVRGVTRASHRYYANRNLYEELGRSSSFNREVSQALGVNNVYELMQSGRRELINPPGTEWHHQPGYPNAIWLVRRCDHRSQELQDFLHPLPGGRGGFSEHF